ncbi:MAG: hypothetical protein ABSE16_14635 [Verrucomicrobiota bacterium]|jgi:hypothetical protein
MKEKTQKNFRPAIALLAFIAVVALIAVFTLPWRAQAQPFYTNNGATGNTNFTGAYTPNQNVVPPTLPLMRVNAQYNAGICSGYFVPGAPLTNSFPAMSYTVPPIVTANGSSTTTNDIIAVTLVTTTGFQLTAITTNGLTVYWQAVGH